MSQSRRRHCGIELPYPGHEQSRKHLRRERNDQIKQQQQQEEEEEYIGDGGTSRAGGESHGYKEDAYGEKLDDEDGEE